MSERDLMEHLTSIQALTFEEGMDIYRNMREIRGKVSTLIAHLRLQPKQEAEITEFTESGKVLPARRDYDSLQEALVAIPSLNSPRMILTSMGGTFDITRID
jgi:hypothetical protein